jgi:hypothetical protein
MSICWDWLTEWLIDWLKQRQTNADDSFRARRMDSTCSIVLPSSKVISDLPHVSMTPVEPVYEMDSMFNNTTNRNIGGIFLFETERDLVHTKKYICTLWTVCCFGCWICTIPSIVVTMYAKAAIQNNRKIRAKVLFNIAFIFSFLGLLLFAVQTGYLAWLVRYFFHRFLVTIKQR